MNRGYDARKLIKGAGRKRMNEYYDMLSDTDLDRIEMRRMIVQDGKTAAGAARLRYESNDSLRGYDALLHHSRQILAEIFDFLDVNSETLIKDLKENGEIHIHPSRVPEIRRLCRLSRLTIEEDVRFRLE